MNTSIRSKLWKQKGLAIIADIFQHYIIHLNSIRAIDCGHCSERKIKVKEANKFPFKMGCELWTDKIVNVDKSSKSIVITLNNTAKEIHDIALILKDDERKSPQ